MKLSQWAKNIGISYKSAWRMFKNGQIPNAYKLETGTIIVDNHISHKDGFNVAIYSRVSSNENKDNLESQATRLKKYCLAKGYRIEKVVKEVGSGLNDERPKLEKLILNKNIDIIVVEHKDRLARFGLNYIIKLLECQNRKIEIVNVAENSQNDLMEDFVSIITSFTARLYGKRRSQRKTEKIIMELNNDN